MLKTGHHLSKKEIIEKYNKLNYRHGFGKELNSWVLSVVSDLNGKRILDVGCGYGEILEEIANHFDSQLYGVDFINVRIDEALEKLKGKVVIKNSDIQEEIPFPDNYFDVVFSIETLEHLKEPEKCIKEIKRVLKNNGQFILTMPNATGYFPFHYFGRLIPTRWLRSKLLPYEHPLITDQPIDTCYEYVEIIELLKRNGLIIKEIEGARYFRYLQTIPLIRDIYRFFYPFVNLVMAKINAKRFAYNLLFLCNLDPRNNDRAKKI